MTSGLTAQHHICLCSVPDKKDASHDEWSVFSLSLSVNFMVNGVWIISLSFHSFNGFKLGASLGYQWLEDGLREMWLDRRYEVHRRFGKHCF